MTFDRITILRFWLVIRLKNLQKSKNVNLQNCGQIYFLSNKMRVMTELRFFMIFACKLTNKNVENIEKSEPQKQNSNRLFF